MTDPGRELHGGQGRSEPWAAIVKPGTVVYELAGVSEEPARATCLLAQAPRPLPVRHAGRQSDEKHKHYVLK